LKLVDSVSDGPAAADLARLVRIWDQAALKVGNELVVSFYPPASTRLASATTRRFGHPSR